MIEPNGQGLWGKLATAISLLASQSIIVIKKINCNMIARDNRGNKF